MEPYITFLSSCTNNIEKRKCDEKRQRPFHSLRTTAFMLLENLAIYRFIAISQLIVHLPICESGKKIL